MSLVKTRYPMWRPREIVELAVDMVTVTIPTSACVTRITRVHIVDSPRALMRVHLTVRVRWEFAVAL